MQLISIILFIFLIILLIYIFLIKDNIMKLFRINLNKLYKKHYTLKNTDVNLPELKGSYNAFKLLNSELFDTVCYLIEEKSILKKQIESYQTELKEIREEINQIKNELLIYKDANLQLKKEINILKET